MKQSKQYTLFTNRDILHLLIPLFIEQLLFMLVGTADTLMVASLGAASVSAVALVDMFSNFISSVLFALSTGGAVVVSQFIGARKILDARESAKQLIFVSLAVGVLICAVSEGFANGIIRAVYGQLEPDLHASTMCYFTITAASYPFIAVYGGCAALFRSMNKAKVTMYVSFASNIINIAGNAILIFACGWGVAGAAYATILARFVSMVIILILMSDTKQLVFVRFRTGFRASWRLIRKILYIGIPGGIENGIFQFGRVIVLGLIASYGTHEIAANAIANTLGHVSCIVGGAFGLAVVTVVGQAVGAGDYGQIKYYVWKMMKWTCCAHFLWNILVFLITPLLLMCFHEIDQQTRHLALILILIHNGIGMFLWPLSFTFPHVLRSMNDVRWPMFISISSMLLVRVGFSYGLAGIVHSGVIAVWIAMVLDWIVRIVGFQLRYHSGAWIRLSHCRNVVQ